MKNYLTVKQNVQNEIIIEKSRFITSLKRVYGEDDAKAFVQEIKGKYPDATHNCYAYIADEGGFFAKFSDDGEPQGTAGLPMLETLKAKGLKQVAVVVTRYFGGIKLGTGGLARAYADMKGKSEADISKIFSKYYKSKIGVMRLENGLLPKDKTPWQWVDTDLFDFPKSMMEGKH